jgi:hypothetical protein
VLKLERQILRCEKTAQKVWEKRKRQMPKHSSKVWKRIRGIQLNEELLFRQLWESLDDFDDFEVISTKNFEGKRRYIYCDGVLHLVSNKNDKFLYGSICNCEEE